MRLVKNIARRAFMYKGIFLRPYYPTQAIMDMVIWVQYVSARMVSVYYVVNTSLNLVGD